MKKFATYVADGDALKGETDGAAKTSIRDRLWFIVLAVLLSSAFRFLMFPPVSLAELGYLFLLPLLLPDWSTRGFRSIIAWGWLAGFLFWFSSLIWLRHVTFAGTVGLAGILAVFTATWLLIYGRWLQSSRSVWVPLTAAALWVLLEWSRTWFLWGFPWNPVSVSQWNRPAVLSVASITGGWGLSFLLVWINVALARWIIQPFTKWREKGFLPYARQIPLMLVIPVGVLAFTSGWYFWNSVKRSPSAPIKVGLVQPYMTMKWEEGEIIENIRRLWDNTRALGPGEADIILWPESSTPMPIIGDEGMRNGIEWLSSEMEAPILMGNMAFYREEGVYENGIFLVDPLEGLNPVYYAKRELVPFGEYIPFRRFLPFLEKVVPIGMDCRPGSEPVLFPFPSNTAVGSEKIGALVCYEDSFPELARSSVVAGADWLFVATNNVWYGEEAGAYQHAAHSVLRAAETRRPVLRSGNGGWSGWIDEWGHVRRAMTNEDGSIYFRGSELVTVERDLRFKDYQTPFVRFGNWFIYLCGLIFGLGFWFSKKASRRVRRSSPRREML